MWGGQSTQACPDDQEFEFSVGSQLLFLEYSMHTRCLITTRWKRFHVNCTITTFEQFFFKFQNSIILHPLYICVYMWMHLQCLNKYMCDCCFATTHSPVNTWRFSLQKVFQCPIFNRQRDRLQKIINVWEIIFSTWEREMTKLWTGSRPLWGLNVYESKYILSNGYRKMTPSMSGMAQSRLQFYYANPAATKLDFP